MAIYPGVQVKAVSNSHRITVSSSIKLDNVIDKFERIPRYSSYIRAHPDQTFVGQTAYDAFDIRALIDKRRKTHFQGIVRTKDGNHIILSGGDNRKKVAQLFIIEMSSYLKNLSIPDDTAIRAAAFGSNVVDNRVPPLQDCLIKVIQINKNGKYWHAGGLGIYDNILVVPLEGDPDDNNDIADSKVKFFDITDPTDPVDLEIDILDSYSKAGATSLIRLNSGKYLCAVWVDSNKHDGKKGRFTYYLSKSHNILDGFGSDPSEYEKEMYPFIALNKNKPLPRFQSIHLALESSDRLFVICTDNRAALSPITRRKNRAFIYEIKFIGQDLGKPDFKLSTSSLHHPKNGKWQEGRIFPIGERQYNFDAGCGIYLTANKELVLYSVHHFKNGSDISFAEFYLNSDDDVITHEDEAIIELYSGKNFEDKVLKLYGRANADIDDFTKVLVEDLPFDRAVRSIRAKIPKGLVYELYENAKTQRADVNKNRLRLNGSGQWIEIVDLDNLDIRTDRVRGIELRNWAKKFGKKTSSSRYL